MPGEWLRAFRRQRAGNVARLGPLTGDRRALLGHKRAVWAATRLIVPRRNASCCWEGADGPCLDRGLAWHDVSSAGRLVISETRPTGDRRPAKVEARAHGAGKRRRRAPPRQCQASGPPGYWNFCLSVSGVHWTSALSSSGQASRPGLRPRFGSRARAGSHPSFMSRNRVDDRRTARDEAVTVAAFWPKTLTIGCAPPPGSVASRCLAALCLPWTDQNSVALAEIAWMATRVRRHGDQQLGQVSKLIQSPARPRTLSRFSASLQKRDCHVRHAGALILEAELLDQSCKTAAPLSSHTAPSWQSRSALDRSALGSARRDCSMYPPVVAHCRMASGRCLRVLDAPRPLESDRRQKAAYGTAELQTRGACESELPSRPPLLCRPRAIRRCPADWLLETCRSLLGQPPPTGGRRMLLARSSQPGPQRTERHDRDRSSPSGKLKPFGALIPAAESAGKSVPRTTQYRFADAGWLDRGRGRRSV